MVHLLDALTKRPHLNLCGSKPSPCQSLLTFRTLWCNLSWRQFRQICKPFALQGSHTFKWLECCNLTPGGDRDAQILLTHIKCLQSVEKRGSRLSCGRSQGTHSDMKILERNRYVINKCKLSPPTVFILCMYSVLDVAMASSAIMTGDSLDVFISYTCKLQIQQTLSATGGCPWGPGNVRKILHIKQFITLLTAIHELNWWSLVLVSIVSLHRP